MENKTEEISNVPVPEKKRKTGWILALKILHTMLLGAGFFFIWVFGLIIISLGSVNPGSMSIFWSLFLLSVLIGENLLVWKKAKKLRNWSGITALIALAAMCLIPFYRWVTVDRYKQMNDRINWYAYAPWRDGSKVVQVTAEPEFYIKKNLPRIDGAYALYPVYSGVVRALYDRGTFEKNSWKFLSTNGSDVTFQKLIDGDVDLIFSAPPSKKQIADAAAKGLKYEITPFAKEAFVFFVNSRNPVRNLTSEQIRNIYAGKITDWSQISAEYKGKIKPFQRNQGSGSQTMLEKIMGTTPLMEPLKEDRLGGMGGIINDVAGYRNYNEALGFTFRYFSTEMFKNGEIRLLSIDGVEPTLENIRDGTYPFIADCCIITVKPRTENIRKIVDFMFSPAGQQLIRETGYTPLSR